MTISADEKRGRVMPYEDDYKMWLEKALIRMNPDWVCDEMSNNEFTHNWCHQYCGEEDAYITPKCLHMFYHHIARADRKTENSSEKPNNSTRSILEHVGKE
jgi:hypothetical protein